MNYLEIAPLNSYARLNVAKPKLTVVDMTKRINFLKHRFISDALISTINKALSKMI